MARSLVRGRRLLLALACAAAGTAWAQGTATAPAAEGSAPDPAQAIPAGRLAAALRDGGWVVYFRHTATDFSRNDSSMRGYDDCSNQRLLSSEGRTQARQIGRQVQALQLPVTEVLASPMCRTLDTARLIFGKATPRDVIREREAGDYPGLRQLLSAPVAPGAIRWVVGHGTPFRAIAGAPHLAEGEAAVLRPTGPDGGAATGIAWTVVARLQVEDWARLAR